MKPKWRYNIRLAEKKGVVVRAGTLERLTWLENRHSTLGEDNILKDIDAGLIITGHNWNEENVIKSYSITEKFLKKYL